MIPGFAQRRQFNDLSDKEILALAIAAEEDGHRRRLIDRFRAAFGETIPLIRREHVAGFYSRKPVWLLENLTPERIRGEAAQMEEAPRRFYLKAAQRSTDAESRKLLGDLAAAEAGHADLAQTLAVRHLDHDAKREEEFKARQRSSC